jgi:fructose/tagatose bisphosphate aldolase
VLVYETPDAMKESLALLEALREDGAVAVKNPALFRNEVVDGLVWTAVFGKSDVREAARRAVREAAASLGILPASILPLYRAIGKGEVSGFTVPALNLRMLAYDSARAALRAARAIDAGAVIFEIARSEMGYTDQRPAEYATVVLGAAIKEDWKGPVFIQGDHYQANPKKFKEDPEKEMRALEALVAESIPAGFLQIDVDTSTLVDLSRKTLPDQQENNSKMTARLVEYIRKIEPKAMPVSIGGEIGEVGKHNTTPEEFRAYIHGLVNRIGDLESISKVSIQTGSSHGGVVGPDGTIVRAAVDFALIQTISRIARQEYGNAGTVQHGASTLPAEYFGSFPDHDCVEIHLATDFQNTVFDHPSLPLPLKREVERWVFETHGSDRKTGETDAQFLYRNRKLAVGRYKERFWTLPPGTREAIAASLERKFAFLFEKLRVRGTRAIVEKHVRPVEVSPAPAAAGAGFVRDDEAGD